MARRGRPMPSSCNCLARPPFFFFSAEEVTAGGVMDGPQERSSSDPRDDRKIRMGNAQKRHCCSQLMTGLRGMGRDRLVKRPIANLLQPKEGRKKRATARDPRADRRRVPVAREEELGFSAGSESKQRAYGRTKATISRDHQRSWACLMEVQLKGRRRQPVQNTEPTRQIVLRPLQHRIIADCRQGYATGRAHQRDQIVACAQPPWPPHRGG